MKKYVKLLNGYYDNMEVNRYFIMPKSHSYYVVCVAKRGVEDVAPLQITILLSFTQTPKHIKIRRYSHSYENLLSFSL